MPETLWISKDGKKAIKVLDGRPLTIHPAIDFKEGVAYVGVWLPCEVSHQPKIEKDELKITYTDEFFLITSNHEIIYAGNYENLREEHGLILESQPVFMKEQRWSIDSINEYLDKATVNPREVFLKIKQKLEYYFEFTEPVIYDFIILWIIGTYFYHIFNSYPYLFINGVKRSGKTKLLIFITLLAHNGINSASISTAGLYYAIQDLRATITIDENERLHEINERTLDMRAALLSGFMKNAYAHRVLGEEGKRKALHQFELYGPKALANIFGIEDILEDRCIVIIMLRALGPQKDREINVLDKEWGMLRDDLYKLYLDYANTIYSIYSNCSKLLEQAGIGSREANLWRPIFAFAQFFEENGVEGLVKKISEMAKNVKELRHIDDLTESTDMILVQVLYDLVKKDNWYSVKEIKEKLIESLGGEKEAPKWVNSHWVGRALMRLNFKEKRKRGTLHEYRLTPESIKRACQRLAIIPLDLTNTPPVNPEQTEQTGQMVDSAKRDVISKWLSNWGYKPNPAQIKLFYESKKEELGSFEEFKKIVDEILEGDKNG